jgi:hypothetical protein
VQHLATVLFFKLFLILWNWFVVLFQGLRMNRTLLSLSLCNNDVSDQGAQKLAEVSCITCMVLD